MQIAVVQEILSVGNMDIPTLLSVDNVSHHSAPTFSGTDLSQAQQDDPELQQIIQFLHNDHLPDDEIQTRKVVVQAHDFAIVDGIVYFVDPKNDHRQRCAVPKHLRTQLLEENHSGPMAGHFSGEKLYRALVQCWWWPWDVCRCH